jgi:ligand-binding sensor domain-containing protein/class 3 adenylate cyclase
LLPGNEISSVVQDSLGNIWVGAEDGGAAKYDGKSFTKYTTAQGLATNNVRSIVQGQKDLWLATGGGGVDKYDGHSFTLYSKAQGLVDTNPRTLFEDRSGNLWVGTEQGVSKYDGKVFTNYTTADGLPGNMVRRILEDKAGLLWFATLGGISKFDGKSFTNYTTADGLVSNDVWCILEDRAGHLWFGTHDGASEYDGKSFTNYTTAQGLADDHIRNILEDRGGNIWFSTMAGGLSLFRGKVLTHCGTKQGLPNDTFWSVFRDRAGNMWFGSDGGVTKYDGQYFTNYTTSQGLAHNSVVSFVEDTLGNLWIGTAGGVSKFDGKTFTNYTPAQGLAGNTINHILRDRDGNLWFSTRTGGVSKFDGKSFTNLGPAQGLADSWVSTTLQDRTGNYWFATHHGVTKYDGKTFTTYTKEDGLKDDSIGNIFIDAQGNIWFSLNGGGLSRYDGRSFLNYSVDDGLSDNGVYWVGSLKDQKLIIGTNLGLTILTGYRSPQNTQPAQNNLSNEELNNYKPVFEIYNRKTGYPLDDMTEHNSFALDKDGAAWIGTGPRKTALVRFDYSAIHRPTSPNPVYIQAVKVDHESIIWNDLKDHAPVSSVNVAEEVTTIKKVLNDKTRQEMRERFGDIQFDSVAKWNPLPQNLELPYNHNNIGFEFVAIETDKPEVVVYQYKLEGYDKDWSPALAKSFAEFGNISEGAYEFKVKARGPSGIWSEPVTYAFKVLPPWYRTWWAYTLYGITTLSLLFLIYRWRTAALRRRQRELEDLYQSAQRFLPKDFLRILNKKHFQDVDLGDWAEVEKQTMFSDIRGFTSLTEKLGPHKTALILNKYMGYMAPIVREYDGVVGQFLGDGIMAFFDSKPELAIDAALVMLKTLSAFNKDIQEYGLEPVEIGIGLTIGQAVFTIIGEKERLEGHVISDSVNLSARIESLNKLYKTNFLITGEVYDKISNKDQYLIRLIDKAVVMGRHEGVRIYEVKDMPQKEAFEEAQRYISQFNEAFALIQEEILSKRKRSLPSALHKRLTTA